MNPDHWLASKEHNYQKHQLAQRKEKKLIQTGRLHNINFSKILKQNYKSLASEKKQQKRNPNKWRKNYN